MDREGSPRKGTAHAESQKLTLVLSLSLCGKYMAASTAVHATLTLTFPASLQGVHCAELGVQNEVAGHTSEPALQHRRDPLLL